jgi:transcriptional regulator with XRE-family HTH domain
MVPTMSSLLSAVSYMDEFQQFLQRLREAMDARGWNQSDLARELGVRRATVSDWFARGRVPMGDAVMRMPKALGVDGHWLLTGEVSDSASSAQHRRALEEVRRIADEALGE